MEGETPCFTGPLLVFLLAPGWAFDGGVAVTRGLLIREES